MRIPDLRPLALFVVGLYSLSACSGSASDAMNRVVDAVDEVTGAAQNEEGNVAEGGLFVSNQTEAEVCSLTVEDFDEPEAAGYDLLDGSAPLAPGATRTFPPGDHPLADDHNLHVTAESCDGTTFSEYHFSFVGHGGAYYVHEPLASVE